MEQYNNSKKRGFTLIELMIGMAIIAILAAAMWGNFFTSLGKGRDSRRKQDLQTISKALELYYNDHGSYPQSAPPWGDIFVHETNGSVIYMQKVPNDPAFPNATYCYQTDQDGTYFVLFANMENTSDPELLPAQKDCGGVNYNYGVSSSNTTPSVPH
jgi:prepilin-type N-terminal cleavage/methylation domain-containing protein